MDKTTYHQAMHEADIHFTNRVQKLEMQELLHICNTDPTMHIIDALITAKQVVRNELERELKSITESEVQNG